MPSIDYVFFHVLTKPPSALRSTRHLAKNLVFDRVQKTAVQAVILWLSSAGLPTSPVWSLDGCKPLPAQIKDPVGAQQIQVTYQYASTHAPRYGYGMHFAVRNSAHPESTTFLAANRIKSVAIQAGVRPNDVRFPGSWKA
jgi:hypothetical protein